MPYSWAQGILSLPCGSDICSTNQKSDHHRDEGWCLPPVFSPFYLSLYQVKRHRYFKIRKSSNVWRDSSGVIHKHEWDRFWFFYGFINRKSVLSRRPPTRNQPLAYWLKSRMAFWPHVKSKEIHDFLSRVLSICTRIERLLTILRGVIIERERITAQLTGPIMGRCL